MHDDRGKGSKIAPDIGVRAFLPASRVSPSTSDSSGHILSINVYSPFENSQRGNIRSAVSIGHRSPLYSPEQRRRRDTTAWTLVQGILAPVQFVIFLVSLVLVFRYLATGEGLAAATASIVVKTIALYAIMITGCLWEHAVFGKYLFAKPFFWEDVFSMLVLALHTSYLLVLAGGALGPNGQMYLALAAYAAYVINAVQFLLKLRAARLDARERTDDFVDYAGAS